MDKKEYGSPLDKITEDGILCLIISFLSLKEAVRTSVISRRWRYIWTRLQNLNFDAAQMFGVTPDCRKDDLKMDKFIRCVNSVLQRHQGEGVEDFRLECFLKTIQPHHLDAWLGYAIAPKTKKLVVNLKHGLFIRRCNASVRSIREPRPYYFPCQLLGSSIENLVLTSCSLKPHYGFGGLHHLKKLHLKHIDVTEEDFKCLVSNCSTLEYLELDACQQLVAITVPQPLSRLRHLEVQDCYSLKKIEIYAINIIGMTYVGNPVEFVFNESKMISALIYFEAPNMDFDLNKLSNSLPHLQNLHFSISCAPKMAAYLAKGSNKFTHLKYLEWRVQPEVENEEGSLCLASLLVAAPQLEKLDLLFDAGFLRLLKQVKPMTPLTHTHLKNVVIAGFNGDKWQIRFAIYILRSAIQLKKMIILKDGRDWNQTCYKNYFETNMECLRQEVPTNVNFLMF